MLSAERTKAAGKALLPAMRLPMLPLLWVVLSLRNHHHPHLVEVAVEGEAGAEALASGKTCMVAERAATRLLRLPLPRLCWVLPGLALDALLSGLVLRPLNSQLAAATGLDGPAWEGAPGLGALRGLMMRMAMTIMAMTMTIAAAIVILAASGVLGAAEDAAAGEVVVEVVGEDEADA